MRKYLIPAIILIVVSLITVQAGHLIDFHRTGESPDTPRPDSPNRPPITSSPKPGAENNAGNPPSPGGSSLAGNTLSDHTAAELDNIPPENQDKTVYSWWYKANKEHLPPQFVNHAKAMVNRKGYYLGKTSEHKIYLTFDEGYENGYTARILDILKENGVRAAFFVTADYVKKQPDLVQRMVAEGHIVGNHTATHPSLPKLNNNEIRREILITHKAVKALTGLNMKYMRPPMGEYNARVIDLLNRLYYKPVFWSMAYRDWDVKNQPGEDAAYRHVMDNLHPGALILLHAVSSSNTEALDRIIKGIMHQGYSFSTLDELK